MLNKIHTYLLQKDIDTLDEELQLLVYKHQVRPHLEYGNAIWHHFYEQGEGVQCRAIIIIPDLRYKLYHECQERIGRLNMYSVEYSRRQCDMIHTYKIMQDIGRIYSNTFLLQLNINGPEET